MDRSPAGPEHWAKLKRKRAMLEGKVGGMGAWEKG